MTVPSWVCGSAIRACKNTHLVLVVFSQALIDGVFAGDGPDVRFRLAPLLTAADVADVLATISAPYVFITMRRYGL